MRYTTEGEKAERYKAVLDKTGDRKQAGKAKDAYKAKVIVETRGEGGFIFTEPTYGYEVTQGDLSEIPTIDAMERAIIMGVCRMFDEVQKDPISGKSDSATTGRYKVTPWEAYDEQGDIIAELIDQGWGIADEMDGRVFVQRPGADSEQSGNYHLDKKVLYIFSTNTCFPEEQGLRPSAAYAFLYHDGDFAAAAKALFKRGYGEKYDMHEQEVINEIKDKVRQGASPSDVASQYTGQVDLDVQTIAEQIEAEVDQQESEQRGPFWVITTNKSGKQKLSIKQRLLAKFCHDVLDFAVYFPDDKDKGLKLIKIDNDRRTISLSVFKELKDEIDDWIFANIENQRIANWVAEELVVKKASIFTDGWLEFFDEMREVNNPTRAGQFCFLRDWSGASYHFFKNGYVEITKDGYKLCNYAEMPDRHYIWDTQVIDFEFKMMDIDLPNCQWYQFMRRISGITKEFDGKELADTELERWRSTMSRSTS
jgi:hypothetical protein